MNRNRFAVLLAMMLLSIVGITWVQTIWIRKAVTIQNESFDAAVSVSLANAAQNIESARKLNFFNNIMFNDPSFMNSPQMGSFLNIQGNSPGSGGEVNISITNQSYSGDSRKGTITTTRKSYILSGDSTIVADSSTVIVTPGDTPGKINMIKQGSDTQAKPAAGYMEQNEFLEWLQKRSSEFKNLSDQMIMEIYNWERALDIDKKDIESALRQSFGFRGIKTPYEYAVIKDGVVQEGKYKKSQKKDFLKSNYIVRLFPDNIIRQDILLSVIFPERTNYVLGSMIWILGGSLVFSLFIMATFAMSLFFLIRQKKISEMKSDFLNNMTHEFKTPIATISLAADTITNPKVIKDEASIRHFIGMIKKENSRMNKKVETILQIASLDKKEIEFHYENISLHSLIGHAVDTIDIQVQQRDGKIRLNLEAGDHMVYGDAEHLTNLVNNLLDNAIKYSPESPDITVSTRNTDRGIIMSVEDKGIGMTKAVQSKIFERFYRQSSGNVHDVKGFGLGLNYARAIIDAHKGNIHVTSEPGKGSRFDVFLPLNWEN
jgi:two-component system, OmpR family, phosphate regulon sensor histidine kinase PhoR